MTGASELVTDLLGKPAAARVAQFLTSRRLRVLAYHGVPEQRAFRAQMEHLVRRYSPVSGSLVVAAVEGRDSLPRHAVWITFDDGYPDVLEHAEPVLAEFRIPATLFVVAGLVDTDHHLATPLDDPFRMSRVRIDSTANLRRFGAIVSGDHPGAYTAAVVARERLRRTASRSHLSAGVKP